MILSLQLNQAIWDYQKTRCRDSLLELTKLYARIGRVFEIDILKTLSKEDVDILPQEVFPEVVYHWIQSKTVSQTHDTYVLGVLSPPEDTALPTRINLKEGLSLAHEFEGKHLKSIQKDALLILCRVDLVTKSKGEAHPVTDGHFNHYFTVRGNSPFWLPAWFFFEDPEIGRIVFLQWMGMEVDKDAGPGPQED